MIKSAQKVIYKKKSVNYTLRLPEKLKYLVAEKAKEEYRSANQEAIFLLCKALGMNPKDLDK